MVVRGATSNLRGACWAVLAVLLFSTIFVSGKLAGDSATALQILWFRYFGGFLTVACAAALGPTPIARLRSEQPGLHAIRSVSGGLGTAGGIYAAAHMPVASATAIGLMDGVFTILLAVVFLKERLAKNMWAASLLCVVSAQFVVLQSGPVSIDVEAHSLAVVIAIAGALSLAVENVLIKTLVKSERPLGVLLYVNFFGTLIFLAPAIYFGNWENPAQSLVFLLLGPIATLGQYCNIRAFMSADAAVVAPMRYSWIVFATLWGVLLFDEIPSGVFYVGAFFVVIGGAWLATSRSPS